MPCYIERDVKDISTGNQNMANCLFVNSCFSGRVSRPCHFEEEKLHVIVFEYRLSILLMMNNLLIKSKNQLAIKNAFEILEIVLANPEELQDAKMMIPLIFYENDNLDRFFSLAKSISDKHDFKKFAYILVLLLRFINGQFHQKCNEEEINKLYRRCLHKYIEVVEQFREILKEVILKGK